MNETSIRIPRSSSSVSHYLARIDKILGIQGSLSISGRIAYFGSLLAILISSIPHGTTEPWHKGLLVTCLAMLGGFRGIDKGQNGGFRIAEPWLLLPLTGIVGLAALQLMPIPAVASLHRYETQAFLLIFSALIVLGELLFNYTRTTVRLRHLVYVVLILAFGSSLVGAVRDLAPSVTSDASYAQFANRNHFSVLIEMGLGLLLGILLKADLSHKVRFVGWVGVAFLVYSIIAANSRGGLVSLAGLAVFAVFVHIMSRSRSAGVRTRKRRANASRQPTLLTKLLTASGLCVLVFGLIVSLVAFIGSDNVVTRIEQIDKEVGTIEQSRVNRAAIWASTIELIKRNPLVGSGFGAFGQAITKFDSTNGRFDLEQAHNDYLEIVANGGAIAALLFFIFGCLVVIRITRNMRAPERFRRACCFGAITGVFGVLIHSSVDFGLHVLVNATTLVVLIVIGVSRIESSAESKTSGSDRPISSPTTQAGWRPRVYAIVYIVVVFALAIGGARHATSNYFVQRSLASRSLDGAVTASVIQPENSAAEDARGIALLQRSDFSGAVEAFRRSVNLSPNDYELWSRLGSASFSAGEYESAQAAYLRSIELAPNYSRPRIEFGKLLLQLGKRDRAFEFLSSAVRLDQSYYAEVLNLASAEFVKDPVAIEQAIAPVSAKEKSIVAWYFLDRGWMTDQIRAFLLSGELTSDEKNTIIRFLKEKKNFLLARDVWLSRMGTDANGEMGGTGIFDGGFESITESDPSGLGWQVEQDITATAVARDQRNHYSGNTAVNIRFGGLVELQRPILSQIVFVEPGKQYKLTFHFRATELVSGGLPALLITDPGTYQILGRSETIEDTKGNWVQRSVTFTAGNEAAVIVSLQRPNCAAKPCPIFGELWIDDISLNRERE